MRALLAVAWLLAVAGAQAATCGDTLPAKTRRAVEAGGVTLAYAPRPAPIPLDRHFELDLVVCGAVASAVRVDAEMPAHRHGMNYRATVAAAGEGRFVARGLLFHMPGRWRLLFDVDLPGRTQRLVHDLELE